jgi:hypothetical protein
MCACSRPSRSACCTPRGELRVPRDWRGPSMPRSTTAATCSNARRLASDPLRAAARAVPHWTQTGGSSGRSRRRLTGAETNTRPHISTPGCSGCAQCTIRGPFSLTQRGSPHEPAACDGCAARRPGSARGADDGSGLPSGPAIHSDALRAWIEARIRRAAHRGQRAHRATASRIPDAVRIGLMRHPGQQRPSRTVSVHAPTVRSAERLVTRSSTASTVKIQR